MKNWKIIERTLRRADDVSVASSSRNRIHVIMQNGDSYLFHILSWSRLVTPGYVRSRVDKWDEHSGHEIRGHVILAAGQASATLRDFMSKEPKWTALLTGLDGRSPKWFMSSDGPESIIDIIRSLEISRLPRIPSIAREAPISVDTAEVLPEPITSTARVIQEHPFIPPTVGARVDDYKLMSFLGSGKTSLVYSARVERELTELGLERGTNVALKFYNMWVLQQAFQFERIGRELMVTSRLAHPSIIRIYDLRISPLRTHRTYMVMEFVEGTSLYALVADNPMFAFDETLLYSRQIFEGLSHLHSAGVLHRDIKPENIMISNEKKVKIMDFGVVKPTDTEGELTGSTQFLGTIRYASPEYLLGQECTARSDIYSAAAVCYYMLYGREIFPKDMHFARQVLSVAGVQVQFPTLRQQDPGASEFRHMLQACLDKDPAKRPSTAADVLERIVQLL